MFDSVDIAFFDVDETIIAEKSMFTFLDFVLHRRGLDREARLANLEAFKRHAQAGMPREEVNRLYYRQWAGTSWQWLLDAGRDWYDARASSLYLSDGLALLHQFQRGGAAIVLVSGSFMPCLEPIASALGVRDVICTEPMIAAGVCTGAIGQPMIGKNKAIYTERYVRKHAYRAEMVAAVGDHTSDADLINQFSHRFYVGDDPETAALARKHGWAHAAEVLETTERNTTHG